MKMAAWIGTGGALLVSLIVILFSGRSVPNRPGTNDRSSSQAIEVEWESLRGEDLSRYVRNLSIHEVRLFLAKEQRPNDLRGADWLGQITIWQPHPSADFYLEIFARYAELDFDEAWESISEGGMPVSSDLADAVYRGRGRALGLDSINELLRQLETIADADDLWRIEALIAATKGWAEVEPKAALDWAWLYHGGAREYLLVGVLMGLPKTTSWSELWSKAENLGSVVLDNGGSWNAKEGEFAEVLAERWIQVDPEAAINWMRHSTAEYGSNFMPDAFAAWLKADTSAAVQWLAAAEAEGRFEDGELARRVYYATSARSDDILSEVMKLKAGSTRDFAIEALIDRHEVYNGTLGKIIASDDIPDALREEAKERLNR